MAAAWLCAKLLPRIIEKEHILLDYWKDTAVHRNCVVIKHCIRENAQDA